MPVLRFSPGRVEEVLGLPLREALKWMERLKIEAEMTEEGMVELEIEVDRPDMYSLEGIARQLAGLLGRERGLPRYETLDSGFTVEAEQVPTRPYVAAAVVWDVNVDEEYLLELIQMQEKLHGSIGGGRERVAIGLHDLDKLPSRKLRYAYIDIDSVRFVPLGGSREMSLREVLEETEQGRSYGKLALRDGKHPVLFSGDVVISVPPVINSEATRVEPGTRSILVDVTGTELEPVLETLVIVASSLAERSRGRRIGLVRVEAPWGALVEPRMEPRRMSLSLDYASRLLGVEMTVEEAVEHLERMRFSVLSPGKVLEVAVPRYRIDILHEADLVEEILLSIGVENLKPIPISSMLRGSLLGYRFWEREARKLLVGHGFTEVMTYTLVPCRYSEEAGIPAEAVVELANPIGPESACLRATLLPQLLDVAARNQHLIPLRIFETGEVYLSSGTGDVGVEARKKLSILVMDRKAGFEDVQAVVYSIMRLLGDDIINVEPIMHPMLIPGRAARVKTREGIEAVLGEARPEILEKRGITYPVALAEIDYTGLKQGLGGAAVPRP